MIARATLAFVFPFFALAACGGDGDAPEPVEDPVASADVPEGLDWTTLQDSTHRVAVVEGLDGPEAVRWDRDQGVWFVSNFGGDAEGDGFISRVSAGGQIESLRFIVGDAEAPLDDPRGMEIIGDTLWVADARGVHGFNRRTGDRVAFIDFSAHEPGFLNDVARGPEGGLWVSDTGRSRLYRIRGRNVLVVKEGADLASPNGIHYDSYRERFILAPWEEGAGGIKAWQVGMDAVEHLGDSQGGSFDGVEVVDLRVLVASQADSAIHILALDSVRTRPFIKVGGRPADIGVDREGRRIAVPYIALDRVDIWPLPRR